MKNKMLTKIGLILILSVLISFPVSAINTEDIGTSSYALKGGRSVCTWGINQCSGWRIFENRDRINMPQSAVIHPFNGEWVYLYYLTNIYTTNEAVSIDVSQADKVVYFYDHTLSNTDPDSEKIANNIGEGSAILGASFGQDTENTIFLNPDNKKSFYVKGWVYLPGLTISDGGKLVGYKMTALKEGDFDALKSNIDSTLYTMLSRNGNAYIQLTGETPYNEEGAPTAQGDTIKQGEVLRPGDYLFSRDGRYKLMYGFYQIDDGNLVLSIKGISVKELGYPIWNSGTGNPGTVVMQNDGNFVIYNSNNNAVFDTGTNSGTKFVVQNDGNLVVYDKNGKAVWNAGTTQYDGSNKQSNDNQQNYRMPSKKSSSLTSTPTIPTSTPTPISTPKYEAVSWQGTEITPTPTPISTPKYEAVSWQGTEITLTPTPISTPKYETVSWQGTEITPTPTPTPTSVSYKPIAGWQVTNQSFVVYN